MPKTQVDLSWQAAYAAEYLRTTGRVMTFGPVLRGGQYPINFPDTAQTLPTLVRKGEAIANTERLRARETFVEVVE